MDSFCQSFQPIHQPRTGAADQVIIERHDVVVSYSLDGIPSGALLDHVNGCTKLGITQQDKIRVLDDQFFLAYLGPWNGQASSGVRPASLEDHFIHERTGTGGPWFGRI